MKAYLYILNTLADWEIAHLTSEINSGRYLDKTKEPVELIKIGNTLDTIKTMGGISITPDKIIDNITFKEGDLLILPGADTWYGNDNEKILKKVPELLNKNIIVGAICGATIALAQNKILDNKKHTSNDKNFLKMICPEYKGEENYQNTSVVSDRNLITASGLAPLEFTYEIFKKTKMMKPETIEVWYQLYKTKESKYFHSLMESLE